MLDIYPTTHYLRFDSSSFYNVCFFPWLLDIFLNKTFHTHSIKCIYLELIFFFFFLVSGAELQVMKISESA